MSSTISFSERLARAFQQGRNWMVYVAVLMALTVIALNEYGFQRSTQSLTDLARLEAQRTALGELNSLMAHAETSQRGYLLTGNTKYLRDYDSAQKLIDPTLTKVRDFYSHTPQQIALFAKISRPVSRKMAEMDVTVKLRQAEPDQMNWLAAINTDVGLKAMDDINAGLDILKRENELRGIVAVRELNRNQLISRLGVAIGAILSLMSFYFFLRQSKRLQEAQTRQKALLAAERDMLDSLVVQRTARLRELATHILNVQEGERARLARELHDEMGALFTAAKLDVARIRSRLGTGVDEAVAKRMQHLTEALNSGIALKRRIIEDLMPSSLSNLGLASTLDIHAREFAERTGVEVDVDVESVQTTRGMDLAIFRIVQESLNNIAKYAQAKNVQVTLHNRLSTIELQIKDDGVGFDVKAKAKSSHGLPGMLHRVEALSGQMVIDSAPGKGTSVLVVLPKPRAEDLANTSVSLPPAAVPPDSEFGAGTAPPMAHTLPS